MQPVSKIIINKNSRAGNFPRGCFNGSVCKLPPAKMRNSGFGGWENGSRHPPK